jgi:NADPH-dependent 2,4-dienoyl-CoA reductase/sulfur reductase-like enzyme
VTPEYQYLIIGGGMTGDAAVLGIREADSRGTIGLIGAEPDPPYNRPPLSKALWKGEPEESVWRPDAAATSAELHLGRRVVRIDAAAHTVTDDAGTTYRYRKVLLATGGTPRRLPGDPPEVIYYRTFRDYRRLRDLADHKQRFVVIGGGFIGSEVAAALRTVGREVSMIIPENGLGTRIFPADLAHFLEEYYREKGVLMHMDEGFAGLTPPGSRTIVRTTKGNELEADGVVAGIGIVPALELARQAGLTTGNGIEVDAFCRTSHPDLYAAGDGASFPNPALGIRLRVEHEDNANAMGRVAGLNMAGRETRYDHLPFFYSDLFDLGYEAVGELDPRLETFSDWVEPFRQGVVYYLKDGRVRGVLLWNTWGQLDAARTLIAEPGPFRATDLRGRIR